MTAVVLIGARFVQLLLLGLLFGMPLIGRPPARLLASLALAGAMASVIGTAALAADMTGAGIADLDWATFATVATLPGSGVAFEVRLAALVVVVAAALLAPRQARPVAMAGGAIALATTAWSGHAAASDGSAGPVHLTVDIVHLLAAGTWLGALAVFVCDSLRKPAALLLPALSGFAHTGTIIVVLLTVTGVANAAFIGGLPPPAQMIDSRWTFLMALKLAAFLGMLLLAARHRFQLVPGLARGAPRFDALRFSLALELAAGVTVVGLVAWAGRLDPAG